MRELSVKGHYSEAGFCKEGPQALPMRAQQLVAISLEGSVG